MFEFGGTAIAKRVVGACGKSRPHGRKQGSEAGALRAD